MINQNTNEPIDDLANQPLNDLDVGNPGETVEQFEVRRIRALGTRPPPVASDNPYQPLAVSQDLRNHVGLVVQTALRQEFQGVRSMLKGLRDTLEEQEAAMKTLEVPLEQVVGAHERASSSFESLRFEIRNISDRLGKVEGVIDTAGLLDAHNRSSQLLADLAATINEQQRMVQGSLTDLVGQLSRIQGERLEEAVHQQMRNETARREREKKAAIKKATLLHAAGYKPKGKGRRP
jgi:Skp family chaperone for outer membrane proteins